MGNADGIADLDLEAVREPRRGIAARVYYEGTELNRSARIFGGNLPMASYPFSAASTGTQLSALSTITGSLSTTTENLRTAMQGDFFETRTPSEEGVEFIWKPSTVPTYQQYNNSNLPIVTTATTNTPVQTTTSYYASPGQNGSQAGQNALVIVVEGDTTSAAQAACNQYEVEVVWHWEIVPDNTNGVAYDVSASPSHSLELDQAFNTLASIPPGRLIKKGTTVGTAMRVDFPRRR